jgi:hypothetical protein
MRIGSTSERSELCLLFYFKKEKNKNKNENQ